MQFGKLLPCVLVAIGAVCLIVVLCTSVHGESGGVKPHHENGESDIMEVDISSHSDLMRPETITTSKDYGDPAKTISSSTITITGYGYYYNENLRPFPIKDARVAIFDEDSDLPSGAGQDFGNVDDDLLTITYTNDDGYFSCEVTNLDGGGFKGGQEIYVAIYARGDAGYIYTDSGGIYRVSSSTQPTASNGDTIAIPSLYYGAGLTHYGAPFYLYESLDIAYQWLLSETGWSRSLVEVEFPSTETSMFHAPDDYISINQGGGWQEITLWHEYGHAVMWAAYGNAYPEFQTHLTHSPTVETDGGFALIEGWAELFQCAVDNNATALIQGGMPTIGYTSAGYEIEMGTCIEGNYWQLVTDDGGQEDWDGDIIEGSVASILWDIYDDSSAIDKFTLISDPITGGDIDWDWSSDGKDILSWAFDHNDVLCKNEFEESFSKGIDELLYILINYKPQDIVALYNNWFNSGLEGLHWMKAIYMNHGITRPWETAPVINSMNIINREGAEAPYYGGILQLSANAVDSDAEDYDYLEVNWYYMRDYNENGIADDIDGWVRIGHHSTRSGDAFSRGWDTSSLPQDGHYIIKAEANDDIFTGSSELSIIVDNTPPGMPTLSSSHTYGQWSNVDYVTFNWQDMTDTNQMTYYYVLDHIWHTIPDLSSASTTGLTKSFPSVADGIWYFHLRVKDQGGNFGNVVHFQLKIDDTPPETKGGHSLKESDYVHDPGYTNNPYPSFTWTASTDTTSGLYGYYISVDTPSQNEIFSATEAFTIANALIDGQHTIYIRSVDVAGNSAQESFTFWVITTPPAEPAVKNVENSGHPYPGEPNKWATSEYQPYISLYTQFDAIESHQVALHFRMSGPDYSDYTLFDFDLSTTPYYYTYKQLTPGTYGISVYAEDIAGNIGPTLWGAVTLDPFNPQASISYTGIEGTEWYRTGGSLLFTATDAGLSGHYGTYYRVNSGSWGIYSESNPPELTTAGIYTVEYYAEDYAMNKESTKTKTYKVDLLPPTTSLVKNDPVPGDPGWETTRIFTLEVTDADSGPLWLYYKLDDGAWIRIPGWETQDITVESDGEYELSYYGMDRAGNIEPTHVITLKVDTVPPNAEFQVHTGQQRYNGIYITDVGISVTAADATSGINYIRMEWFKNGAHVTTRDVQPGYCYTINQDGKWVLRAFSVDNAFLVSDTVEITVIRDTELPSVGSDFDEGLNGWYTRAELHATDATSGISEISYSLDDGATWETCSAPDFVLPDGQYNLRYYTVDLAGFKSTEYAMSVKIDTIPPVTDLTYSGPEGYHDYTVDGELYWLYFQGPADFELSATDVGSGLLETRWVIWSGNYPLTLDELELYTGPSQAVDDSSVIFRSRDIAGNWERGGYSQYDLRSMHVCIDTIPPETSWEDYYSNPQSDYFTIKLMFTDNKHHFHEMGYQVNDGEWLAKTNWEDVHLQLSRDTPQTVRVSSTDKNGNVEDVKEFIFLPELRAHNILVSHGTITAKVVNYGEINAQNVKVQILGDRPIGPPVVLHTKTLAELRVGDIRAVESPPIDNIGLYTSIRVVVDPDNTIPESDESDNDMSKPLSTVAEEWVVDTQETMIDKIFLLRESLFVMPGGTLELIGCSLIVQNSALLQNPIVIENGGTLILEDTIISPAITSYPITLEARGELELYGAHFKDTIIIREGDLGIPEGDFAIIENCELKMDCSTDLEYAIYVPAGSTWHLIDTSVTSNNPPNRYYLLGGGDILNVNSGFTHEAEFGIMMNCPETSKVAPKGGSVQYEITVTNIGNLFDTITLDATTEPRYGWSISLSQSSLDLNAGESATVTLTVNAPSDPRPPFPPLDGNTSFPNFPVRITASATQTQVGGTSTGDIEKTASLTFNTQILTFGTPYPPLSEDEVDTTIHPGETGSVIVDVTNPYAETTDFILSLVDVPDDWNATISDDNVTIPSGGSTSITITITVPEDVEFGRSSLSLYCALASDPETYCSMMIHVDVEPETILTVQIQEHVPVWTYKTVALSADIESTHDIISHKWDLGDGAISYDAAPYHQYSDDGTYTVTLRVVDAIGQVATASRVVLVQNRAPIPDIQIYQEVTISLQIAGRKDNTVTMTVYEMEENTVVNAISVTREPGQPQMDTFILEKHIDRTYLILLEYNATAEGDNPVWVNFTRASEEVIHHTFVSADGFNQSVEYDINDKLANVTVGDYTYYFDASQSYDLDGDVTNYTWQMGDGSIEYGGEAAHTYSTTGDYTAHLTVSDDDGAVSEEEILVSVA